MRKTKKAICYLLICLFGILYPALKLEAESVVMEVEQKKTEGDCRPVIYYDYIETEEDIAEEIEWQIFAGQLELIAQLVMAEASNQDLTGKRLVVDVVLNRVDDPRFPNTVEEVIFQPNQFSPIWNGRFEKAGWNITPECYEAVLMEFEEWLDQNASWNNSRNKDQ